MTAKNEYSLSAKNKTKQKGNTFMERLAKTVRKEVLNKPNKKHLEVEQNRHTLLKNLETN